MDRLMLKLILIMLLFTSGCFYASHNHKEYYPDGQLKSSDGYGVVTWFKNIDISDPNLYYSSQSHDIKAITRYGTLETK
jgi:hypothetical protein